jgi:BTB/POZ domain
MGRFRNVLRRNPHQHPLLYLKGVKYKELTSVLNFMYQGEVNVAQDELNSFLAVAEELKVKGDNSRTQGNGEKTWYTWRKSVFLLEDVVPVSGSFDRNLVRPLKKQSCSGSDILFETSPRFIK